MSKGKVPNRSHTQPKNLPGYRCMSTASMPSTKSGAGSKMSRAHGTNSGDPAKGMTNAAGRLGANSKRFSSGIPSNAGGPRKLS
jgi:hypothetical protein